MTDEQAVVETADTQAKPVVEGNDAQDDVESLLSQYDDATKPEPDKTSDKTSNVESRIESLERQLADRDVDAAISEVVKNVTGDLPVENDITQAWLEKQVGGDKRLLNAFLDRAKNPSDWAKIEANLKKQFGARFKQAPDKETSDAKAALTAAVRSASTKAPEEDQPDFSKMPDGEFNRWKRDHGL